MRTVLKNLVLSVAPPVRRIKQQRDELYADVLEKNRLIDELQRERSEYVPYINTVSAVLQFREAYYEVRGHIAPGAALPTSRAWPEPDSSLSYTSLQRD
jgi:hypothetical protein